MSQCGCSTHVHGNKGKNLYSFFCLKQAKTNVFLNYVLCILFNKIGEQEGRTDSGRTLLFQEGESGPNNVHVSKCKNDKKKKKRKTKPHVYIPKIG
jgi:hypothetical protein